MSGSEVEAIDRVDRARGGDRRALAELFSAHRDRLGRMVRSRLDRRLRGRVDAEDVLQEAYLDASRRLEHFAGAAPMSAFLWLRLVVGQTLADVHRRHLGARMRDAGRDVPIAGRPGPGSSSAPLAGQLAAELTTPSQAAVREEMEAQLRRAVDALGPVDREVLVLRHFEELTNAEVAEALGLQPKAASIRYIRAAGRLKLALARLPGFIEMG